MKYKKIKGFKSTILFKTIFCILTIGMLFVTATSSFAAKGGNKGGGTTEPPVAIVPDNACMQDVYTLSGGSGTLNCTANDIQLFQASLSVVNGDDCSGPGDTATIDLSVLAVLTAQARHDIGIYLATQGDALTGTCDISTLPYSPDSDYADLDHTSDDPNGIVQDTCGDIDDQHNPIETFIGRLTIQCTDVNNDGLVDLPSCASWRQPGANELCTDPTDAYPGSPSKCRCESITLDLVVQPVNLQVVKTASPDIIDEPGGDVTFTVEVTNTSTYNVAATIETIIDDIYGDLTDTGNTLISNSTCTVPQTLTGGETYSCSFVAPVSGQGNDKHTNVVTVTGHDDNNQLTASATETVQIVDVPSAISISKTASPTTVSEPGGNVLFSFIISNDSAVDSVTINSLDDTVYGDLNGQGSCSVPQTLAPGGEYTCDFTAYVSGSAGFIENNIVTASGVDDDGGPVIASDSATVMVSNIFSTVQLVKTATPDQVLEPGGDVTFNFTVHNPSDVDTITITSLTDNVYGDLNGQGTCSLPQTLTPSTDYSCAISTFVAGNAGDVHINVATVSGTDDDGQAVSDSDDATVTVTDVPSAIEVIKTASPNQVTEPGGDVTFTITINNLSVVDAVTINTLTDSIYDDLTTQSATTCAMPQSISAGDSYSCSFTVFVAGVAGETEVNVATASGLDDDGNPVTASDDETVTITSGSDNTLVCDIDGDGDVDINDINLINDARGTTAEPGDPRDVNGDGIITVNDSRACVLLCTNENCTAS